jgi:branched-chain amino acid transport system substrate-binding protein
MQRLISQDQVDVIVGGWGSSQVLAHQATVERAGVPYIIVGATNPKITTKDNKWTFRVIKSDANQAVEIANAAVNTLGLKSIAVLYDSNDYGTGNKDVFVAALQGMGMEPVSVASYGTNDKDFTAQLSEVKAANPDGLAVFGTIPGAPAIMIQARQLGIDAQFIGTGGLANEQLIELGGDASEGTVLTTYFDSATTPDAEAWANQYEQKYAGQSPPPRPILAAWEYRAIKQIMAPCLEQSGTDKNAIRECLAGFDGKVIGFDEPVHFDDTNQLMQPTILVQVKDGKFALYR